MTSRPSASSKRPSTNPTPIEPIAKTPCKIHSFAVIADKAQITGTYSVEVGESSVLHPYCKIRAEQGEVIIGKNSTISEAAVVGVLEGNGAKAATIGDGVNIEAGAVVEAKSVGDGTSIEAGAKVGTGAVIGKHCKITPLNEIKAGEEVPDYTVVYGNNQRRIDQTVNSNPEIIEARRKAQEQHVELLRKLIPDASAKWR